MPNLQDLTDRNFAEQEAEKFALLVAPDGIEASLQSSADLINCLERAGSQSPEAYEKFSALWF